MMTKKQLLGLGFATIALTATTQAAIIADWQFDDLNESVSATTGALNGGASLSAGNLVNTSTGSADGFNGGVNAGLGGTGSFTIVTDFTTSSATNQTLFSYSPTAGAGGGQDIRLFAQGNGNIRVEMSAGAGFEIDLSGDGIDLTDGAKHRAAVIFNSAAGDSFFDLDVYVDGNLYDVTGGTDHTVNLGNTTDFFVGRNHAAGDRELVGSVDFVQVHDTALTTVEIAAVPEPSATALLGVGGLTLILRRRK